MLTDRYGLALSTMSSTAAPFSQKTPNIPGLPSSIGRRNPAAGNGIS